jgi:hypothetical protein
MPVLNICGLIVIHKLASSKSSEIEAERNILSFNSHSLSFNTKSSPNGRVADPSTPPK